MVNKQNIALALGKIEEIIVLMRDVRELIEGEYTTINQFDTSISNAYRSGALAVDTIYTTRDNLQRLMNEN